MTAATIAPTRLRLGLAALAVGAASAFGTPALARGPDGIADVAEKVIDAVVNISTSQTVEAKGGGGGSDAMPQLPPGSPFEEFFDDFFKNRRGRAAAKGGERLQPHKTNSLGSGFIVDTSGIVVTNNHVIADADEINVILNDGTKIKAELVGVDKKTDLAVLKFKPPKPLIAVKFGDSDKLRLGDWVIAIGNPFSLGGTVTAGIVSAKNRDISSGPLRQLHPDRRRHQPRQFRRSAVQPRWRGHRRQHADHLAVRRLDRHRLCRAVEDGRRRGRPVAAVRRIAPRLARRAHPAGHRRDRREPQHQAGARRAGRRRRRQGPGQSPPASSPATSSSSSTARTSRSRRISRASSPTRRSARKSMSSSSARARRRPRRSRSAGSRIPTRLQAAVKTRTSRAEKTVTQKALGLDLAALSKDLRTRYKIKDSVKGVVVTDVDANSDAAEKRLSAGDVIVEVAQEAVSSAADIQKRVDQLKKDGKKSVLLLVRTPTASCGLWR